MYRYCRYIKKCTEYHKPNIMQRMKWIAKKKKKEEGNKKRGKTNYVFNNSGPTVTFEIVSCVCALSVNCIHVSGHVTQLIVFKYLNLIKLIAL